MLNIGRYVVPLEKPRIKLLQKSQAFWKLLGDRHIFSIIQRVPITFPPVPFRGLLLSGMCVPDLRGSQGTFSLLQHRSQDEQATPFTRAASRRSCAARATASARASSAPTTACCAPAGA